jgi:hypothetical protein
MSYWRQIERDAVMADAAAAAAAAAASGGTPMDRKFGTAAVDLRTRAVNYRHTPESCDRV